MIDRKVSNGFSKRRFAPAGVLVNIGPPKGAIERIDLRLDDRDIPLSRNNWFLETAIEKLRCDAVGGTHGKE